ncbi:MAG: Bug family tripartite tricarboxylate transporter substrate binding protein [Carbonactinosporaceae bacterium]
MIRLSRRHPGFSSSDGGFLMPQPRGSALRFLAALVAAPALLLSACGTGTGAGGGDYPSEDIELVVPYEPGGGYDTWARLLAPYIEKHLPNKVNIVIRNMPGAGGLTAANTLYAADPDGTQIQLMNLTGIVAAQLGTAQKFDVRDFTFLGRVTNDPQVLCVSPGSGINDIADLEQRSPIKQAMTGFASSEGVDTIILYDKFGIEYTPVMHEGNSEARLSIIRGDTTAGISSLESALEELQGGDLKPILYAGQKPRQGEPGYEFVKDVETLDEAGHPELSKGLEAQRIIVAPPQLPDEIKGRLDKAIQGALADPGFQRKAEESNLAPNPLGAAEAHSLVRETIHFLSSHRAAIRETIEEQG